MILIYTTAENEKEAEKIVEALLKKRLAACCNIFPIKSRYWWKGKIEKGKEFAILCKTTEKKADAAEKEIKNLHLYETPVIIRFNTTASKEYEEYVVKSTEDKKCLIK